MNARDKNREKGDIKWQNLLKAQLKMLYAL